MPLTPAERTDIAVAFLRCFGEDAQAAGKVMKYVSDFAAQPLLAAFLAAADTWPPFIASGLSIPAWKDSVTAQFNATQTA